MLSTCTNSDDIIDDSSLDATLKKGNDQPTFVTVPFKANFIGTYTDLIFSDPTCDESYFCRVFVDYTGTATHLGKINGSFEFCACGPDDPATEEADYKYEGGETTFTAANGDKLFLLSEGSRVVVGSLPEHPEYVIEYWRDNFIITGGTGRFEGATGSGTSDDYNSSLDPNSHHSWKGTLTMKKGKRK